MHQCAVDGGLVLVVLTWSRNKGRPVYDLSVSGVASQCITVQSLGCEVCQCARYFRGKSASKDEETRVRDDALYVCSRATYGGDART